MHSFNKPLSASCNQRLACAPGYLPAIHSADGEAPRRPDPCPKFNSTPRLHLRWSFLSVRGCLPALGLASKHGEDGFSHDPSSLVAYIVFFFLPLLHDLATGPQETDQLEEEKAELESEIAELQKEKERLEFVLVAHKPGCKIPYEEGPGPGPLAEVRDLPGSASTKEDGFSWLLPPPPPPPLPFQTSQDAPPNLTASLFTHSEVQVLGDPFPVVNPSYTSSFVLTCPEVSAFAGAHRTSGSDQPSDPLNSPSLLAL